MSLTYKPVTQSILCLILLICIATTHCLNYSGQKSKLQFTVYDSDIPSNEVKVIKPGMNCITPSKVIIMQSLKDLP